MTGEDKQDKNGQGSTEELKRRLKACAEEATEKLDIAEIEWLVGQLEDKEEKNRKTEEAEKKERERFREYCKNRMAEGGLLTEETIRSITDAVEKRTAKEQERRHSAVPRKKRAFQTRLPVFWTKHKAAAVAAVLLVAVCLLAGSQRAVNAAKKGGFFYWLSKDKEGVTMITAPENMETGTDTTTDAVYTSLAELPEEYLQYIVDKEQFATLQEYEFREVGVSKGTYFCMLQQFMLEAKTGKGITIGVNIYRNEAVLERENYFSEGEEAVEWITGEGTILIKEGIQGSDEYTLLFYSGNKKYFVEGDCDKEKLKEIAAEYIKIVNGSGYRNR